MNFKTYFTYNCCTKKNKITVRKEHFPIAKYGWKESPVSEGNCSE